MPMIKVQVRQNESLEAALRRFKRQCNQSGLFAEMKERKFHTKSTTERRIEGKERIQTIRRAERVRRQARY
ncbi:MAG: 30S ribosomal protein S21 [Planctomycetota bacterium]|nr:30S ribosomal protein S21 [Planctomycetota bacterium]